MFGRHADAHRHPVLFVKVWTPIVIGVTAGKCALKTARHPEQTQLCCVRSANNVSHLGVIVGFMPTIYNHCRALCMDVRHKGEHDARTTPQASLRMK
jgi:hypothetical protein